MGRRGKSSSGFLGRFIWSFIIQPLYNEEVVYSMALAVETTNDGKAANKEIPNREASLRDNPFGSLENEVVESSSSLHCKMMVIIPSSPSLPLHSSVGRSPWKMFPFARAFEHEEERKMRRESTWYDTLSRLLTLACYLHLQRFLSPLELSALLGFNSIHQTFLLPLINRERDVHDLTRMNLFRSLLIVS